MRLKASTGEEKDKTDGKRKADDNKEDEGPAKKSYVRIFSEMAQTCPRKTEHGQKECSQRMCMCAMPVWNNLMLNILLRFIKYYLL